MTATMQDVARVAGVSLKSVSRVINREAHVSEILRNKVEAAIGALGYVPDPAARSLAGSRAFLIGLLFDNPSPNYTMKVQTGVYRACVAAQHHLRIDTIGTDPSADVAAQVANVLHNGRCDGFVLTPPLTDNRVLLDMLDARGVRYARIAPHVDPDRSPAVAIDDAGAAAEMARYLWDLGHRRFGLVTGPVDHAAARARRAGFVEELARLGCAETPVEVAGGFHFEGGIAAGLAILAQPRRPTAIFATNDDSAAGVMAACSQGGVRVPGDMAVAGFDDSWIARSVWPYLTTIHQPIEAMAHAAATLLLARDPGRNGITMLDYQLVARDSTAPPA
jgi:LacI family transcriptional regulator